MGDAFDMMEDPSAAADADDVYNGILGEIGLEYNVGQPAVATTSLAQPQAAAQEEVKNEDDGLEARLAALRMWVTIWWTTSKWKDYIALIQDFRRNRRENDVKPAWKIATPMSTFLFAKHKLFKSKSAHI